MTNQISRIFSQLATNFSTFSHGLTEGGEQPAASLAAPAAAASYQYCLLALTPPMFDSATPIIKTMWSDTKMAVQEACKTLTAKAENARAKITLKAQNVLSNGFAVNGVRMLIADGSSVECTLFFKKTKNKDGKGTNFAVEKIRFKFSKPVIGACNFEIKGLSLGETIGGAFGALTEKDILKIMKDKVVVAKYDAKKAGALTKPMVIAFDTLDVTPNENDPFNPTASLSMTSNSTYEKGWSVYSFGASEDDCIGKNLKGPKSEYLGDTKAGDGTCRSREAGPRFGRPIVQWIFKVKEWSELYKKFYQQTSVPGFALAAVVNHILGSGAGSGETWKEISSKLDSLGSIYREWKTSKKLSAYLLCAKYSRMSFFISSSRFVNSSLCLRFLCVARATCVIIGSARVTSM